MRDSENLRIHPTNAGGEAGPSLGRFSSRDVLSIGASLLVGLILFILISSWKLSFAFSTLMAASVPFLTTGLLFMLASKPAGYAGHWLEWQWIKWRRTRLWGTPQLKWEETDHAG